MRIIFSKFQNKWQIRPGLHWQICLPAPRKPNLFKLSSLSISMVKWAFWHPLTVMGGVNKIPMRHNSGQMQSSRTFFFFLSKIIKRGQNSSSALRTPHFLRKHVCSPSLQQLSNCSLSMSSQRECTQDSIISTGCGEHAYNYNFHILSSLKDF